MINCNILEHKDRFFTWVYMDFLMKVENFDPVPCDNQKKFVTLWGCLFNYKTASCLRV
jgi:hypothetical protein